MKLSKDEIALLRSLVEWRRANGWTYKVAWDKPSFDRDGAPMSDLLRRHTWESPELPNGERAYVEAMVIEGELWALNYAPDYGDTTLAHLPGTAFMDMARVIFGAGRESAYTTGGEIEWSCRMKDGRPAFASSFTEGGARRYAADDPERLAVFKRRVWPWEEVSDVDS